jgi:hypothetical protein
MGRQSHKAIERILKIGSMTEAEAYEFLRSEKSASVLELGHAKSEDAHCLACGFEMVGGRHVGLCPKCGSDRWYRTRLSPNDQALRPAEETTKQP